MDLDSKAVNRRVASSNLARESTFSHFLFFDLKYTDKETEEPSRALLAIKVVREGSWGLR
jgi:hypothetical protein